MIEPGKKPEENLVTYVVQRQRDGEFDAGDGKMDQCLEAWVDIATVRVPPRTKRATVIKQALKDAGITSRDAPPKLRALDAESAEVHEPEAYQPPMEWKL